jgi:hypothetical protein
MAALNLDLAFFQHPKTVRLVGRLGKGAEVLLIRLWCHCGVHHSGDGKLSGYSPSEIETTVGWWGKPGEMVAAMIGLRWLEQDSDGDMRVHDWVEHQGHIAAFKAKGRAMAMARWNTASNADSNAARGSPALPKPTNQPTEAANQKSSGRPRSLEEVQAAAAISGLAGQDAERFWHHFESSGWVDKNGNRVLNWRSKLASWAANGRANLAEAKHHGQGPVGGSSGAQLILNQKELERVEKRISDIKNSYDSHQDHSGKDKAALSRLWARKRELKTKLGVMV